MSSTDNKELIKRLYDMINAGDLPGVLERFADDVRWTNIGTTRYSGTFVGKDSLVNDLLGPVFGQVDGYRSTVLRVIAEGDHVVVQSTGESTTKSGKPYNNTYCHVFTLADAKVVEVTEYMDTELITNALG